MSDWAWIIVGWVALSFVFGLLWAAAGRGRSERTHALDEMVRAEMARRGPSTYYDVARSMSSDPEVHDAIDRAEREKRSLP